MTRKCRDCKSDAEVQIHFVHAILERGNLTIADKVERRDVCFSCFLEKGYLNLSPVNIVDGKGAAPGAFLAYKGLLSFRSSIKTSDALYVEPIQYAAPDDLVDCESCGQWVTEEEIHPGGDRQTINGLMAYPDSCDRCPGRI